LMKDGRYSYVSSDRKECSISDHRVRIIVPSMGTISSQLFAAAFRGIGFNTVSDNPPSVKTLMLGRSNTSCKECLPLILTTGSLLTCADHRRSSNDLLLYFMPTAPGNCRFSQYYVFQKKLIEKKQLRNVALITLTAENSYAGLRNLDQIRLIKALITADVMDDIKNAILVLAVDKERAIKIFNEQLESVTSSFEQGAGNLYPLLKSVASRLSELELLHPLSKTKKVLLTGEIYIRRNEFCSQPVIEHLAKRGIIVKRSPILEWLYYVDYVVRNHLRPDLSFGERTELFIRRLVYHSVERKVKSILAASGLVEDEKIDMNKIVNTGSRFINPAMTGEAIVSVGTFFNEIVKHIHGVVSIGPFACMATRVTDSILSRESQAAGNKRLKFLENVKELQQFHTLPFLSVEVDGNPFPQIVEARIEAFALQVERMHETLRRTCVRKTRDAC